MNLDCLMEQVGKLYDGENTYAFMLKHGYYDKTDDVPCSVVDFMDDFHFIENQDSIIMFEELLKMVKKDELNKMMLLFKIPDELLNECRSKVELHNILKVKKLFPSEYELSKEESISHNYVYAVIDPLVLEYPEDIEMGISRK